MSYIGRKCPNEFIITKKFKDTTPTKHYAFRLVTSDAINGPDYVVECSSSNDYPIGITLEDVFTTEDVLEKSVNIQIAGIGVAIADGDISITNTIQATTDGKVVAGSAPTFLTGIALQNAVKNDQVVFEFNKQKII